jgi:hypothetical protein
MLELLNAAVVHPRHPRLVVNRADALINAYEDIAQRVGLSLRIQNGDVTRLRAQLDEVRAFSLDAQRVREIHIMYNVRHMISCRHETYWSKTNMISYNCPLTRCWKV